MKALIYRNKDRFMHKIIKRTIAKFTGAPRYRVATALVAILLVGLGLYHGHHKVVSTIPVKPAAGVSNYHKANSGQDTADAQAVKNDNAKNNTPQAAADTPSVVDAPYGAFVSNHFPGANGSPNNEVSACNTTPGATCYIEFTKGSIVKTLPAKAIDSTGAVSWSWNISDAGLSSGKWQIKAIAQAGDSTKTTTDPIDLTIQ